MAGTADGPRHGQSAERTPGEPPLRREPDTRRRTGAAGQRPVALLVAGHSDGRALAERLGSHFEIIAATDVPSAVAVLTDVPLDVLLIDAALPDPTMMELITQARVRQWLRELPIICYATARPGATVSRLAGVVANDVIVEPVATSEFAARITATLPTARPDLGRL